MAKVWLIARHHFMKEASKRSFLIVLLSMPLVLAFGLGFGYLVANIMNKDVTLGYVDPAGFLKVTRLEDSEAKVRLVPYGSIDDARAALNGEQIDAYYVIPEEYPGDKQVELIYIEEPDGSAYGYFRNVIRLNLLTGQPDSVVDRLMSGAIVTVKATEANREYPRGGPSAGQILPILFAFIFAFLTLTTAGFMLQVLVEEKDSRTIEILISSVSPNQMMGGKILGTIAIATVQLIVWAIFFGLAIWIGQVVLDVEWLQTIEPIWRDIVLLTIVAIPTYIFFASLMTIIGAVMSDGQEADQVGPLVFLLLFVPIYLIVPIAANPNGLLAVVLTLIPFTSLLTIAIRTLFVEIPAWQFIGAALIASLCTAGAIWLAGKALRLSMLRYGQRLPFAELFGRKSAEPDVGS